MEQLGNILKILFVYDSEGIISDSFLPKPDYRCKDINNNALTHLLVSNGLVATLDQAESLVNTLVGKWMLPDEGYHMLLFKHSRSVFNTLLHFSAFRIHLKDGEPICNHDMILAWNNLAQYLGEDLLVTSYLASRDIVDNRKRVDYAWKVCLESDARDLNYILERPMWDVHSHLKGSSANFELNWICLMNHITKRAKEFRLFDQHKLTVETEVSHRSNTSSLYLKIIKAAAIRLFLFLNNENLFSLEDLDEILTSHNDLLLYSQLDKLQSQIDVTRLNAYIPHKYSFVDYAIISPCGKLNDVLSGERSLMYNCFRSIYDNQWSSMRENLFYAYLVIKEELRKEITQINDNLGFHNFSEYEERKATFIPYNTEYDKLLQQLAVGSFIEGKSNTRYIETRVTPQKSVKKIAASIRSYDNAIKQDLYSKESYNWNFHYVFHYIKKKDHEYKDSFVDRLLPRHSKLREEVRKETLAIFNFRNGNSKWIERLVGIDAANSEIYCRPEVFAVAFRCLRAHPINNYSAYSGCRHKDLGRTYHVGEDFYSIVDGLRAVDEVIKFFHFGNGDRIGHGLVLGTNVYEYYSKRNFYVNTTVQTLLDDIVWLYVNGKRLNCSSSVAEYLIELYKEYSIQLLGNKTVYDIYTYYQSWLLRGDDPTAYRQYYASVGISKKAEYLSVHALSVWERNSFNYGKDFSIARQNTNAVQLYYRYHFDADVKSNGNKPVVFKIEKDFRKPIVDIIAKVQEEMLSDIEKKHISIECNPTSNIRIGEFSKYEEHPIFKFNNYGLSTPYKPHNICVSINTDDQGVFATSLEREFALIALSIEKTKNEEMKNHPRAILDWLDRVRMMADEQRFAID